MPATIPSLLLRFRERWRGEGGYRELLRLALPLIASTGSISLQQFIDRLILSRYSPAAVAASTPAGITSFTMLIFFVGTASYVSTFVAQYQGAKQPQRVGPSLWQGMYVALAAGLVHLPLLYLAEPFFRWVGHTPAAVPLLEADYFRALCWRAVPATACAAISGYYAGMGRTWPVMWTTLGAVAVNTLAAYPLVLGHWGLPRMGITGAGMATVIAAWGQLAVYMIIIATRRDERQHFHTLSGWRFEWPLFKRLMRFGMARGLHGFLDIAAFTAFILVLGSLGVTALAATNISFDINSLLFMPLVGLGTATSVLVGRQMGAEQPDRAARSVRAALELSTIYVLPLCALYAFAPGMFLALFNLDRPEYEGVRAQAVILLRFVAVYSLVDQFNIILIAALGGAGDTRFCMAMSVTLAGLLMVLPTCLGILVYHQGLYFAWSALSAWVMVLAVAVFWRYRGGKWRQMRVIEASTPQVAPVYPEVPAPGDGH